MRHSFADKSYDAPFNAANPLIGIAPGSCSVVDQLYTNPGPPSATTSLPSPLVPMMQAASPNGMSFTLPANLFLADNNTAQSANALIFVQGQEWRANFAVVNPQSMGADEAQVRHVLRMNPEDFAAWNPAGAETQFMTVLRGTAPPQDLTIDDLPTSGDHLVNGTFTIQNPSWRTTITCNTRGDQPFALPSHAFHSIECGPQSPCNGTARLNIVPSGPATVGMTLGPDNSLGKVNGFDRVIITLSFTLPAALKK